MSRRPAGSSADSARLILSVLGWVRKAVACDSATVQVLLPGEAGRLRPFASEGDPVSGGRLRSSRRRQVFDTKQPLELALRDPRGSSLALYPLAADGETIGVIEIVAPSENLRRRREILSAVIDQSSIVLRTVVDRQVNATTLNSMGVMLRLTADLLRADAPRSAVRGTVERCFEHAGGPTAGLLPNPSGVGWQVVASKGVDATRRAELRRCIQEVSALDRSRAAREGLAERFAVTLGRRQARAIDAGAAVLLTTKTRSHHLDFLSTAGSLLSEALARLGAVELAQARNQHLDLALAVTAHELRGPLAGARAALDHVVVDDSRRQSQVLLRRTKDELEQLAELVDPLLRWSAGSASLRMRQVDLVRVVREAVASSCLESERADVVIEAPDRMTVRADAPQLRGAIANIVRNALAYSPPGTPVRVLVDESDGVARVSVRDRGPGVPAAERPLIFDPFAQGQAGIGARQGKGLGLFIARRIVEAHGGCVGLRPVRKGAEFCMEIPLPAGGRTTSAS